MKLLPVILSLVLAGAAWADTIVTPDGDIYRGTVEVEAVILGTNPPITDWSDIVAPPTTGMVQSVILNGATNVPNTNGVVNLGNTPSNFASRVILNGETNEVSEGTIDLGTVETGNPFDQELNTYDTAAFSGMSVGALTFAGLVESAATNLTTIFTSSSDDQTFQDIDASYAGHAMAYMYGYGYPNARDKLVISYNYGATFVHTNITDSDDNAGSQLAMSADGKYMVADDGPNGETKQSQGEPPVFEFTATAQHAYYAMSGDGAVIAMNDGVGSGPLFTTNKFLDVYEPDDGIATDGAMAVSPDGSAVYLAADDHLMYVSTNAGRTFIEQSGPSVGGGQYKRLEAANDGRFIAVDQNGYLNIWQAVTPIAYTASTWGEHVFGGMIPPLDFDGSVYDADISDNGEVLAVLTKPGGPVYTNRLYYTRNYADWAQIDMPPPAGFNPEKIAMSGDGSCIYIAGYDTTIERYQVKLLRFADDSAPAVEVSIDSSVVADIAGTDGLRYAAADDGYDVLGYTGTNASVVIPPYYMGKPVRKVLATAYGFGTITNLVSYVPELELLMVEQVVAGNTGTRTTAAIVFSAFSGNASLRSVTLYNMPTIGREFDVTNNVILGGAFARCSALQSLSAPDTLVVASRSFLRCGALTDIYLPRAEDIGEWAFSEAASDSYSQVYLPSAVRIGRSAFSRAGVGSISLPAAVTIGNGAFFKCTYMTNFHAPSATHIGTFALQKSDALENLSLPAAVYVGRGNFGQILTNIYLPKATYVGSGYDLGTLESVNMASLRKIRAEMFKNAGALTYVWMPAAEHAGAAAFEGCTSLLEISLPSLRTAESRLFYGCTALYKANLPQLETVPAKAFGNTAITRVVSSVNINESSDVALLAAAKRIDMGAFSGCTALEHVSLPSVTHVERNAFGSSNQDYDPGNPDYIVPCLALTNVYLPNALYVGGGAFGQTAVDMVNVNNATYVGGYAFAHTPITRSYVDEEDIYGDIVTTNYTTNNVLGGWILAMKAQATPTIWNTTVGADTNANEYARPLESLSTDIKGVKIVWDGNEKEMPIEHANRTGCEYNAALGYDWVGNNHYEWGAYHLGISDRGSGHAYGQTIIGEPYGGGCSPSSDQGWGWGHRGGINGVQSFGWYGVSSNVVPMPTAYVYIATQLTTGVVTTNVTTNYGIVTVLTNFHMNLPSAQRIGAYAFYDTPNLERVTAAAVHSVGWGGTFVSSGVKDVYMPSLHDVPTNMFVGADNLTNFVAHEDTIVPVLTNITSDVNLWGTNRLHHIVAIGQDEAPGTFMLSLGEDVLGLQLTGLDTPFYGLGARLGDERYPDAVGDDYTPILQIGGELYGGLWGLHNVKFDDTINIAHTSDERLFQITLAGHTLSMGYPGGGDDDVYPLTTWSDEYGWMWEGGMTESALDFIVGERSLAQLSGNVVPTSSNAFDLGSADYPWRSLYVSSNSIHLGSTILSVDTNTGGLNVQAVGTNFTNTVAYLTESNATATYLAKADANTLISNTLYNVNGEAILRQEGSFAGDGVLSLGDLDAGSGSRYALSMSSVDDNIAMGVFSGSDPYPEAGNQYIKIGPSAGLIYAQGSNTVFAVTSNGITYNGDALATTNVVAGYLTESNAAATYQPIGDYLLPYDNMTGTTVTAGSNVSNSLSMTSTGLYAQGTATWWDDVQMPMTTAGGGSAALATFRSGIDLLRFAGNAVDDANFSLQTTHGIKTNGEVRIHAHAIMDGTNTAPVTGTVIYCWANIDGTFTDTATNGWSFTPTGTAYQHRVVPVLTLTNLLTGSAGVIGRLIRADNANNDGMFVPFMDAHIESDKLGSDNEIP